MNIAIFTDFFLPSLGGVQTSIINQKRTLEAAGHSVLIFAPCYKGDVPFEEKSGVIRLPSLSLIELDGHRGFMAFPWHIKKIESIIRQRNIDIIHIQTEFLIGLTGLKLAKKMTIPSVYTSHTLLWKQIKLIHRFPTSLTLFSIMYLRLYSGISRPSLKKTTKSNWTERQWIRMVIGITSKVDAVVTPSHHLAEKLRHPVNHSRIATIPNTTNFDMRPFYPLPNVPVILWVARFSPEKRPLEFIKAVRQLSANTNKPFRVVMCGTGPLKSTCQANSTSLSALTFTSVTTYDQMPKIYDKASVLMVTSYNFDNQPMTIAEALARRRGVIYCDADLSSDGLDSGAGLLTGPTPEEMAESMRIVIENPDKLDMMSKKSVKAAERFSEQHYLSAIEGVYQTLIRKKPPTTRL